MSDCTAPACRAGIGSTSFYVSENQRAAPMLGGSVAGSTGVNVAACAEDPVYIVSPFAVEMRSPVCNVGSFFTSKGAKPKAFLPLHVQLVTSCFRYKKAVSRAAYCCPSPAMAVPISVPKNTLVLL